MCYQWKHPHLFSLVLFYFWITHIHTLNPCCNHLKTVCVNFKIIVLTAFTNMWYYMGTIIWDIVIRTYVHTYTHTFICIFVLKNILMKNEIRYIICSVKYISLCVDMFSALLCVCVCVSRWVGSYCNLTPDVYPLCPLLLNSSLSSTKAGYTHTYNHPPWTSSVA